MDSDDESVDHEEANFQAELQRALEASKIESRIQAPRQHPTAAATSSAEPQSNQSAANGFLSERAQMEKERRERQKRMRKEAGLDDDDNDQQAGGRSAKRQHLSSSSGVRTNNGRPSPGSSSPQNAGSSKAAVHVPTIEQVFWDGEFRQTATRYAEPRKDGRPTFRLTEILGEVIYKISLNRDSSGMAPYLCVLCRNRTLRLPSYLRMR